MADTTGNAISVASTLKQLDGARKLVLGDAALYPQIIQGVLPIIGPEAHLDLQRWGADFILEAFANPRLPKYEKQQMCTLVLGTINGMLDIRSEDSGVLKSAILASASLYPLVFNHILIAPHDTASWEAMTVIKAKILRMWDSTTVSIKICCIKFAQNVVMAQTPGVMVDPRKLEINDISLSMVPPEHPVVSASNLEAEAQGLLDRMLDVYQLNGSDALSIDSTINCLSMLIRNRASTYNKIITKTLNFNPFKDVSPSMSGRTRVMAKSMERTTKAFLLNANKRNPQHPLSGRILQYVERLLQSRAELLDISSKKREAPAEPTDGLDQKKRARLGAGLRPQRLVVPPLPPGPVSFAQLFTIKNDDFFTSFHVEQLPQEIVAGISVSLLMKIDEDLLNDAIDGIRSRYAALQEQTPKAIQPGVSDVEDEEDDYDPEFVTMEDNEQILNKLDSETFDRLPKTPEISLAPFHAPQPPALSRIDAERLGETMIQRLLNAANSAKAAQGPVKKIKPGLHRLAGGDREVDSWKAVVIRLIARGDTGSPEDLIKSEIKADEATMSLNNVIRNALFSYILDDFRSRMITAFDWLNEEWYNDRLHSPKTQTAVNNYDYWAMKLLNGIFPYVDARDKNLMIRFLSEMPEVTAPLLAKFKDLAKDPERVIPVVNALYYLVLFRPPSREMALDALEDLWRNYEGARTSAGKMLSRYRPQLMNLDQKATTVSGGTEQAIAA